MPYALDSPLSAAAGALGGFLDAKSKKRQQDIANARNQSLDAQTAADTAARLGLERSNQEATAAYRKTQQDQGAQRLAIERGNSDRAAMEAARVAADDADKTRRQGLIDTFQGQGLHYPKNWATMKPEAKIAYLQVRIDKAQKAGDSKTVSNTETEINRVATQAEADRRQAALDKQRGVQNANTAQRIQISVDRGAAADRRGAATAGDPQSFADVSGRLAHAKTRDAAQAILDSPEGSLLSDRQYSRLQKQVDETYGSHVESHKTPKKTEAELRDEDFRHAKEVYNQPNADKNGIVNAFAAKWRLTPQNAKAYFK